ncbi:hypothetical protein ACFVXC_10975 [Streptomyces sp. NPDC058257]|uniref:hypothetical protein n=1 Tax=Streptomyces sp. NPDC058257 TaxID=3346409 RepID=UPI0036ECD057
MTKMIGHVEYANDETEATDLLSEYSESVDLPWGLIPQRKREASVRIATYEDKNNGLAAAKKTIDDDVSEQRRAERVAERKAEIEKQADSLVKAVGVKSGAGLLLDLCRHHYEQANHPNFTFGSGMTESEYAYFRQEWEDASELTAERYDQFTKLYATAIQDKEALGKGQVGDTLATRGRQGNVFVTIAGAKFNAHIDIKGKKK